MTMPRISLLTAALVLCLSGCGIFDDSDQFDDEDTDTGEPEPEPPREGFRVHPKYLLMDVPAVVTVERGGPPEVCPLDENLGGYVCDATAVASTVTITVERDGFDPAVRNPVITPEQIVDFDVHLSPTGGPTGMWSGCVAAGQFQTCGDVCTDQMLECVVASCGVDNPEAPIATVQTFQDGECMVPLDGYVTTCNEALPIAAGPSLRCCCTAP